MEEFDLVPSYAETSLPPEAVSAVRFFGGTPARVAVLAYFAAHPHSTVGEAAAGTDISRNTVKNHTFTLLNEGAIEADARRWPQTRYSLRREVSEAHYRELGRLLGLAD